MLFRKLIVALLLIFSISVVQAQRLCEALVEDALDDTSQNCVEQDGEIGCYAYDNLASTFFSEESQGSFIRPGNIVDIATLHTIEGVEIDLEEDEWGIAYIQARVNLDEATAESAVRIFMLGEVFLENAVDSTAEDADVVFGSLYFTAGEESDCQEAPNTLVVQGPEGESIDITINDVPIRIGSTIGLGLATQDEENRMWITVIAGEATLYPDSPTEVVIPEGNFAEAPIVPRSDTDTAMVFDSVTGEPIVSLKGEPVIRLSPIAEFSEPMPLSDDATGYRNPAYYDTIRLLPESLLNYPLTSTSCLVTANDESSITHTGPGENRGTYKYLDPTLDVTVTGKKIIDGVVWWQLDKDDVPGSAAAVLELWVNESAVEESGDCNSVVDVDAPPIIPADSPTEEEPEAEGTATDVPQTDVVVPAVGPQVSISISSGTVGVGECTTANVTAEFVSRAFISGPGSIASTTVTGTSMSTQICPPSEEGTYTYSIDGYGLDDTQFTQKFASVTVSAGT